MRFMKPSRWAVLSAFAKATADPPKRWREVGRPATSLIRSETVQISVAAGRDEIRLRAPARRMRRVPRRPGRAAAHAVNVPELRRTHAVGRGRVVRARRVTGGIHRQRAIRRRPCYDVVLIGVSPTPLTTVPFSVSAVSFLRLLLSECRSSTLFAITAPLRSTRDPCRSDPSRSPRLSRGPLSAEVCAPGLAPRRRQRPGLTDLVRASEATQIGAVAGAGTGHEKGHLILLRRHLNDATAVNVMTTSATAIHWIRVLISMLLPLSRVSVVRLSLSGHDQITWCLEPDHVNDVESRGVKKATVFTEVPARPGVLSIGSSASPDLLCHGEMPRAIFASTPPISSTTRQGRGRMAQDETARLVAPVVEDMPQQNDVRT